MQFQSVRIVIENHDSYLLAQHNNHLPENTGKWGLPGGRIEQGEAFEQTIRREMLEEFSLKLGRLIEIADFVYKENLHKVFAFKYCGKRNLSFDENEILAIKWLSYRELLDFEKEGLFHTGFELAAVGSYRNMLLKE